MHLSRTIIFAFFHAIKIAGRQVREKLINSRSEKVCEKTAESSSVDRLNYTFLDSLKSINKSENEIGMPNQNTPHTLQILFQYGEKSYLRKTVMFCSKL